MDSKDMTALHLLLCVTGLLNETSNNLFSIHDNDNYTTYGGGVQLQVVHTLATEAAGILAFLVKSVGC